MVSVILTPKYGTDDSLQDALSAKHVGQSELDQPY